MIAAILRAQLLSMRMRSARRAGAVFSAITSLIFYGFWAFIGWAAFLFFVSPRNAPNFLPALSSGLLFVMIYWQFAPILSASFGASLDLRKLLVYPIPRGRLFAVEILLRITSCMEMLLLIAGAAIGLILNPLHGPATAAFVITGATIFAATNILLSAGARSLLERTLLRSRLREIMVLFIVLAGLIPQVLVVANIRKAALVRFLPSQLFWPWAAAARLMLHEPAAASAVIAFFYLAAAWWFGRTQFERGIAYDPAQLSAARSGKQESTDRAGGVADALFRLPARFLPDPIAGLVEKELRTLVRIPRFRLVYAMSCFLGIVLYLPGMSGGRRSPSFFTENAMPVMALYGLLMLGQISYWNAFGFDRSAVQAYFSWPIRFRDALLAKNAAVVLLLVPQIIFVAFVARAARLPSSAGKFLETIAVVLVASLYWFAVGNVCSVRLPRAMDPDKMNQMSNKMQAFTIWSAPILLLPVGLAYWARVVFDSEIVFSGVLLIAAILGVTFYWVGIDSAASAANRGRESMLMELSRSEGPVSTT
jgi:ABC-2 type transport system permease protein